MVKKRPNGSFLFGYHEPTRTEARLASALKKLNVPFQEEAPVGQYRVDFLCDGWLVIEVDGESHLTAQAVSADKKRQKDIEDFGFTVIRIPCSELWSEEAARKWAKRIRDMVGKGPEAASLGGESNNAYIREKVEKVREELRKKAVDKGLEIIEERKKAALRPTSFEKRQKDREDGEAGETMEDYFGKKGEDFESLLERFGPGRFSQKDEEESGEETEGKRKRTKSPFRRK